MKIKKYKKLARGQYSIILDDDSILNLHEDLILKYDLLLTKEIDNTMINVFLEENKKYTAYSDALRYLGIKMRSIKEIYEYLDKKMYSNEIINEVVEKLKKEKYLDDNLYASYYVVDRIKMSNDGPYKIMKDLEKKGICIEYINNSIIKFNDKVQQDKIDKLINKQIKSNHNKSSILLKKKILEYLINLGYDRSIILSRLNVIYNFDDEDIKNKEYEKIYKKLSRKYSGYELEQMIKKKMYEKGFR